MVVIKNLVKALSITCYVLIGIYILVCIPMIFGLTPLVVLSGSMEPNFKVGSIIYYEKLTDDMELKKGDIITFKLENMDEPVSHRIYSIEDGLITTKGDANNTTDAIQITRENVLGKDLNIDILYVGYYIKFVNDNRIIFIVSCIVILVLELILSNMNFDIDRKERRNKDGK